MQTAIFFHCSLDKYCRIANITLQTNNKTSGKCRNVGIFCNLDPKMLRCPMGLSYFMTFQNDKKKKNPISSWHIEEGISQRRPG